MTNQFFAEQKELFNKCVVRFKFKKTDGTIREAVGTTNNKFIPASQHPKNPAAPASDKTIPYYDLEAGKWKSMQIDASFMHLQSWKSVPAKYKTPVITPGN